MQCTRSAYREKESKPVDAYAKEFMEVPILPIVQRTPVDVIQQMVYDNALMAQE